MLRDRRQTVRERVKLARERLAHDLVLAPVEQPRKVDGTSDKALVSLVDAGLPCRVDEEPVHQVREVVARRSRDGPIFRQALIWGQYLLYQRVHRLPRSPDDRAVQAFEVGSGVPEAVGVVDAQPADRAVLDQTQDETVSSIEDACVLDPDASQVVDGEEAPVVDLIARNPPVREPVSLRLKQSM